MPAFCGPEAGEVAVLPVMIWEIDCLSNETDAAQRF